LLEACRSFSTSAGVRYSRVRRSRLDCLRGGIEGEGAARYLGSGAFLLRPLEGTFPFRSFGPGKGRGTFLGGKGMPRTITFPITAQNGNVLVTPKKSTTGNCKTFSHWISWDAANALYRPCTYHWRNTRL
jgi:hypothetical protein